MIHKKNTTTSTPHQGFTIVLFLVSITLWSCRSIEKNTDQPKELVSLVKRTLGAENVIEINGIKTHALCQQKREADHLRRKIRYMVVRIADNAIVHEGIFSMGYVKWLNNESVEVYSGSNAGKEENSTKKIINVNSHLQ